MLAFLKSGAAPNEKNALTPIACRCARSGARSARAASAAMRRRSGSSGDAPLVLIPGSSRWPTARRRTRRRAASRRTRGRGGGVASFPSFASKVYNWWLATQSGRLEDTMRNIAPKDAAALDALELREWLDSLDYVLQ